MIRSQLWYSDCCANPAVGDCCAVEENWDDAVSDIARSHTLKQVVKTCSLHTGLSGEALYEALYEQNRRKNISISVLRTFHPELEGANCRWEFDSEFRLIMDVGISLTEGEKRLFQNAAALQFGPDKVRLR